MNFAKPVYLLNLELCFTFDQFLVLVKWQFVIRCWLDTKKKNNDHNWSEEKFNNKLINHYRLIREIQQLNVKKYLSLETLILSLTFNSGDQHLLFVNDGNFNHCSSLTQLRMTEIFISHTYTTVTQCEWQKFPYYCD